jgi:hypothetical protein
MNTARIAGVFYLLTFVSGFAALLLGSGMAAANAVATVSYVMVTVLFYRLFRPVDRGVSLLAAVVSGAGCVANGLAALHVSVLPLNPLAFFGVYCILIGWLIVRSGFVPPALGVLMMIGGASWLTFAWPPLARALAPFNFAPGILGEGALTVWLLAFGVTSTARHTRAA